MIATAELFRCFGRIGLLSFGGPAAQIALMHRELVERRRWLEETQFMRALSFCMLLPGPEAMQLATYAGWRLRGTFGGLVAGLLFVLPGAVVVLGLAMGYVLWGHLPLVEAAFVGVKAAVVVIVIEALLRIARRALNRRAHWLIAALAFLAIFALSVPFPVIVALAALGGYLWLPVTAPARVDAATVRVAVDYRAALLWLALWLVPLAALWLWAGPFLAAIALFFSKLAVVTFGGAYAVLAYMAQTVVAAKGWLSAPQMIDALGLAETTPGPLILVTEFVAFLAGHGQGGMALAIVAAAVSLWMTFVPCFLWIFAFAPLVERLGSHARLAGALSGVTAAVVGVILNLSLWFGLHVLFTDVGTAAFGPFRLALPDPQSLDPLALALAVLAAVLLLRRHWSIPAVLGLCAAAAAIFASL